MEAAYSLYLKNIYSISPWSEFIEFYEASNPVLDAHNLIFGSGGFGNIERPPNLMIFKDNPRNLILDLMVCCINTVGIRDDCYIWARSGPWAHMKIVDMSKWLPSIWGMPYPQTNDTIILLLIMSFDQSRALYFVEKDRVVEVYIEDLGRTAPVS
jgi:hypothetical protein